MTSLTIIGAGKVGKTLGSIWHRTSTIEIGQICNRSLASAQRAADFIGAGAPVDEITMLVPAPFFLLAVPDDQIAPVCKQLVSSGCLQPKTIVFHCSGALGSELLHPAHACGALIASIHPIRSFADPELVTRQFAGTFCGVEGDPEALSALIPMFADVGARCVPIKSTAKSLYHAGAVFGANYVVTLLSIAQQAYEAAGIAPQLALEMLSQLVHDNIDNVFRLGPAAALTGPIARGDCLSVERQQLAVSAWDGGHGEVYQTLVIATQRLADARLKDQGGHSPCD